VDTHCCFEFLAILDPDRHLAVRRVRRSFMHSTLKVRQLREEKGYRIRNVFSEFSILKKNA
jgi:hypothetical protein